MPVPTVRCPCCEGSGRIEAGPPVRFTPIQTKIYLAVRHAAHGIAIEVLADRVYANRRDGGPITAERAIRQQVCLMNKLLSAVGQRVKSENRRYRLISLAAAVPSESSIDPK